MGYEEFINDIQKIEILWISIKIIKFVVIVAVIIAIFYIANKLARQDKGQDIIISHLKECNKNTELIGKQLETMNDNIYYMCELLERQEQESNNDKIE